MTINENDVKVIKDILEELRTYRNSDEEPREMATDGLYDDELELAEKLGITIDK